MKTISRFLMLGLMAGALFSCTDANQKMAEDYIASHILCPSTMKVVSVWDTINPAESWQDTIYHIQKVYGEPLAVPTSFRSYRRIDSVMLDSFQINRKEVPQFYIYHIAFDSQNEYGAMVRDSAQVYILDGVAYSYQDINMKVSEIEWVTMEEGECVPIFTITTNQNYIKEGGWMHLDWY